MISSVTGATNVYWTGRVYEAPRQLKCSWGKLTMRSQPGEDNWFEKLWEQETEGPRTNDG